MRKQDTKFHIEEPLDSSADALLVGFDARHVALEDNEDLLPEAQARQVRKVRAAARQDLRQLLKLTPVERLRRIEMAESRRSFRSRALSELLLAESRRRATVDPEDAENLSRMAGLVLHWTPGRLGERWRDGVSVRVFAHRANALRLAGRLDEAEAAFRDLHTRLLRTRCDEPRANAEVAGFEAALSLRRGEDAAAVRLLTWCVHFQRRRGARRGMARALLRQAEVRALGSDGAGAVECLCWALRVLDPAAYAGERRRIGLRLVHLLLDLSRRGEAAERAAALGAPREEETGDAADEAVARWSWVGGRLASSPGRQRENWTPWDWDALAALPALERALAALDMAAAELAARQGASGDTAVVQAGERLARRLSEVEAEEGLPAALAAVVGAARQRTVRPRLAAAAVAAARDDVRREWLLWSWVD